MNKDKIEHTKKIAVLKEQQNGKSIIIYSDGSAGGSTPDHKNKDYTGFIGAGYHMYIYRNEDINTVPKQHVKGYIPTIAGYITEDLATMPNIGVVTPIMYIDGVVNTEEKGYSDLAEFLGIKNALLTLFNVIKDKKIDETKDIVSVTFKIDNQWIVHTLNQAIELSKLSFEIHFEKTNLEYYKELNENENYRSLYPMALNILYNNGNINKTFKSVLELLTIIKNNNDIIKNFKTFRAFHVQGHGNDYGNLLVDSLAVSARSLAKENKIINEYKVLPRKEYWKENKEYDYMYNYNNLFFMHNVIPKVGVYFQYVVMNYGSKDEVGTKKSDVLFGYILNKDLSQDLKDIINRYNRLYSNEPILLYTINKKELIRNHISKYNWIPNTGYLKPDYKTRKLVSIDDTNIVYPIYPTGLPKIVFDKTLDMDKLITIADEIITNNKSHKYIECFEITNLIYEKDNKDKQFCKLPNGNKVIDINLETQYFGKVKFKLYENIDIITRNDLKNMEKDDIKVYIIIKVIGEGCFEYYTYINNITNDIRGIYCNFYSSKYFIKVK